LPVRVRCPHCNTLCQIAEQHVGVPVQCAFCERQFTARATAAGAVRLDVGAATSAGRVRKRNEDGFLIQHLAWSNLDERRDLALLVVADGLGGHAAGDRASALVVRLLGQALTPLLTSALATPVREVTAAGVSATVAEALQEANRVVLEQAKNDPACKGMGATAAVVLVRDGLAVIGHVGDCRVYHCQAGRLSQVTQDQTLVARMVALGRLTPEEARVHPSRNEVAQAIGRQPELEPGAAQVRLAAGDWLLAACDGLQAHLDTAVLQQEIGQPGAVAAGVAQRLVDLANQRGGSDNCTAVVVRCY
jgi:serine/threonine protein phosphatase PrpC